MIIAWRDWVRDSLLYNLGGVEMLTPLERMKDRRLGAIAKWDSTTRPAVLFLSDFGAYRPVEMVSMLNHNFAPGQTVRVTLYEQDQDTVIYQANFTTWTPPSGSGIPRHLHMLLPQEYSAWFLEVAVTPLEDTEPQSYIGRLWASPIWEPTYGLSFDGTAAPVFDPSRVTESLEGQAYSNSRTRRRRMTAPLRALPEAEVIASAASPGAQCAQALLYEAGTSEPIIILPTIEGATSAQREHIIHRLGIYGRITRVDGPSIRDAVGKMEAKTRLYSMTMDFIEEL